MKNILKDWFQWGRFNIQKCSLWLERDLSIMNLTNAINNNDIREAGNIIKAAKEKSFQTIVNSIACYENYTPLIIAILNKNVSAVNYLKLQGANPNICDKYFIYPIHYAVAKGNIDILDSLLNENLDLNVLDNRGNNVLHYAVFNQQSEVVEYLFKNCNAKAMINCKNNDNATAYELAYSLQNKNVREKIISFFESFNDGDLILNNYNLYNDQIEIISYIIDTREDEGYCYMQ